MTAQQPAYLSASSANALISDLRPTVVSPPALQHINLFLDELLQLLVTSTQSINPYHLRIKGIPAVFSNETTTGESTGLRALGRSAVGEAEVELRSWYESRAKGRTVSGFAPEGKGSGMTADRERANAPFPTEEATELLRLRCMSFSTLAPQTPIPASLEDAVLAAWKLAGGDPSEETIAPSGLWVTAILEHICEHVLSQLSRVVVRDSSISIASLEDLYTALCEDESIWGMFKRMQVRQSLESAIQSGTRSKRGTPSRSSLSDARQGRASPASMSPHGSRTSLNTPRDMILDQASRKQGSPVAYDSSRVSSDQTRHITRKPSLLQKGIIGGLTGHERSPSALNLTTRSLLGAFNEGTDQDAGTSRSKSPQEDEDEFDALMRSSETVKISLTPSRLKTFDTTGRRSAPGSPKQSNFQRRTRGDAPDMPVPPNDSLPPLLPQNVNVDVGGRNSTPQSGHRSRAGSSTKLTPRGGGIIEEQSGEDDDLPGHKKQRKESLAELLASEPADGTSPRRKSGQIKRTVPAVVLGTPPPAVPESTTSASTPPRRSRSRDISDPDDRLAGVSSRKRSEAQELADFFNNTAPPPSTPRQDDEPPPTAKSSKFRGFMSKVTGSGKKKDDDRASTMSSSSSMGQLNAVVRNDGDQPKPRRQKSMRNLSSSTPPSAYKPNDDAVAVPEKQRKASKDDVKLAPPLEQMGAPQRVRVQSVTPVLLQEGRPNGMSDKRPIHPTLSTPEDRHSERSNVSPDRQSSQSTLPKPATEAVVIVDPSLDSKQPLDVLRGQQANRKGGDLQSASGNPAHQQPPDVLRGLRSVPQGSTSLLDLVPAAGPALPDKIALQNSLPTTESAEVNQITGKAVQPAITTVNDESISPDDTTKAQNGTLAPAFIETQHPAPSILLSDLAPLRHLLDHATTAHECRLLLSAILTQYGVPLSSKNLSIDPESRVAAWLLAGRDGPLIPLDMATPSSSTIERDHEHEHDEDQLLTPTQSPLAKIPINVTTSENENENGAGAGAGAGEEEELMSESNLSENSEISEDDVLVTGYVKRISASVGAGVKMMTNAVGLTDQVNGDDDIQDKEKEMVNDE
ncbi:hypothetical protein BCR39DRAFT_267578 [Naematelia encephala]|uniref:Uncharacterized protein n=1 Tax=Naematelia encephala TaxID=71784 RepID=A0A1Y2BG38_9TREE|nr:hypothetical protein BCR39DRAFT_267578 [Naematelia encephala]